MHGQRNIKLCEEIWKIWSVCNFHVKSYVTRTKVELLPGYTHFEHCESFASFFRLKLNILIRNQIYLDEPSAGCTSIPFNDKQKFTPPVPNFITNYALLYIQHWN